MYYLLYIIYIDFNFPVKSYQLALPSYRLFTPTVDVDSETEEPTANPCPKTDTAGKKPYIMQPVSETVGPKSPWKVPGVIPQHKADEAEG